MQLKSAIREICRRFNPGIRLTAHQSMLFCDIAPPDRDALDRDPEAAPRAAHGGHFGRASLVDGVRGLADVRFVDYRGGTRLARAHRSIGSRTGASGIVEGAIHGADDGLPERLRSSVQLGHRPGGASKGEVHDLSWAADCSANRLNFQYQDLVPEEDVIATLASVVDLLQAGPPGKRNARRLLPSQGPSRSGRLGRAIERVVRSTCLRGDRDSLGDGLMRPGSGRTQDRLGSGASGVLPTVRVFREAGRAVSVLLDRIGILSYDRSPNLSLSDLRQDWHLFKQRVGRQNSQHPDKKRKRKETSTKSSGLGKNSQAALMGMARRLGS